MLFWFVNGKRSAQSFLLLMTSFTFVGSALGQEPGDEGYIPADSESTTNDSTVSYPASFFAEYEPISARDMLNRIPGIDSIIGGGGGGGNDRRGLGAGENQILINGKRIAGKENDGRSVLGQIAAKQVQAIEIIRGTSSELDIRSAGPIVNVILSENASKATVTAEINADYYQLDGTVKPGAIFSVNGRGETLNYLATIESEPRYEQEERNESSVLGSGAPKDQTFENRVREQTNYKLNTTLGWQATDSDLLQVNALFEKSDPPREIDRSITVFDPVDSRLALYEDPNNSDLITGYLAAPHLITQNDDPQAERQKWEFGSNFVHNFSGGGQYKLIVVANEEKDDSILNRTSDLSGSNQTILYIDETRRTREKILRNSVNFSLTEGQDLELGIEAALTTLDSWFLLSGDADTSNNTAVASTIEEFRYEPFVVHNWQISSNLAIESSLLAEFSEIKFDDHGLDSNGNRIAETARDFNFWKPKVDIRYDINSSTQFRTTINRDISQLNFRDFTARQDGDLDSNSDSGNPDLVQEKTWQYDFNLEYRLPDDGGILSGRLYYYDIEDVIDRVDASFTRINSVTNLEELVITSTPGNVGDGERYGLELDASIRLGMFDLPAALLTGGLVLQDSSVKDPFTNEDRRIAMNGRGSWKLGFRHDVTKWNLNYGFNYNYGFPDGNQRIDVDDIRDFDRDPGSRIFIEKVAFGGVRFRFDIMNALAGGRCLQRTRFDGFTADGIVEEVENSCITSSRKMALKIRTTF